MNRIALAVAIVAGGCAYLTPAEEATVGSNTVAMSACATKAHACKLAQGGAGLAPCWADFDVCMAPYTDGGK